MSDKFCAHGGLIDVDGTVSCERCDWCPFDESVEEYQGAACTRCGRIRGE